MSKNQHSFYVPTRFGEAVTRATDFINSSPGAAVPKEEFMILSGCSSLWYSNVYVSVATEKVKGATVVKISGDFLTKAFEGDYSNIGKWVKEVKKILAEARMLLELEREDVTNSTFTIQHVQNVQRFTGRIKLSFLHCCEILFELIVQ